MIVINWSVQFEDADRASKYSKGIINLDSHVSMNILNFNISGMPDRHPVLPALEKVNLI